MGILLWILFGALAGWIASMLTGSSGGLLWDIIIGILGAVIGGWIMSALNSTPVTGFNIYSLLVAVLGASVLILILRAVRR